MSQTQSAQRTIGKKPRKHSFFHEHSLSISSIFILALWTFLYVFANPSTHAGSFFGNAIADWSGVVVTVLATKYLYEKGSAESRPCPTASHPLRPGLEYLREHSLSIFLSYYRDRLGASVSENGSQRKTGSGGRKPRFRMDRDLRAGPAHQAHDRAPFKRGPPLAGAGPRHLERKEAPALPVRSNRCPPSAGEPVSVASVCSQKLMHFIRT